MAATAKYQIFTACCIAMLSIQMCSGSAIPIWEFLTRTEKMSHLYSTFAQLVSVHCKATAASETVPVNQCKRSLLGYGYDKLQSFTDAQLDALDPYQRNANELIWSSIMRDHHSATLITTRKPFPTPPASSLLILTHQQPQAATSTASARPFDKNPLFDVDGSHKHTYAMDMDTAYGYSGEAPHHNHNSRTNDRSPASNYPTGPLVTRLRPDGSPVEEDQYRPLPRDDDFESYRQHTLPGNFETTTPSGHQNKHRRIATISAIKQQHLATLALQQQLQPPFEGSRVRRHFSNYRSLQSRTGGYHYAKGQS